MGDTKATNQEMDSCTYASEKRENHWLTASNRNVLTTMVQAVGSKVCGLVASDPMRLDCVLLQ